MSVQNEKKRKPKLFLIILIAAVLTALGVAAAIVIPKLTSRNGQPSETEPVSQETEEPTSTENADDGVYMGDLYWNVDRLEYAGKSDIGMSSRTVEKEDGLYHITFAVNGRQVERRCADKKLVNLIDSQDIMGLILDDQNVIIGIVPINDIVEQFSVNGLYVKENKGEGEFELNTSESMHGRVPVFMNLKDYKVYDVSGLSNNFVGMEVGFSSLRMYDRLFGIDMPNGAKILYVTDRFVEIPIYWNVVRKYNSDIMDTTREPDENGDYVFLMAYEGEQVEIKTKSRSIATQIDRQAAKVMSFEFAENGYVKKVVSASGALKGSTWGSWAHVTDVFGNQVKAEKYSGSDMGTLWEGTLADDVKIFNCSPSADFVGIKVDSVQVTDQVHCLRDSTGEIKYVFIVNRLNDSPIYWNQARKYDTKNKVTTRTPDANGFYWFDMCVNGHEIRLKTPDKDVATTVDSYAARCMGLILEGDVIKKVLSASALTCTGRGTAASWHHIMTITDATHFHAKKTVKTASDYLHEIDVEIAPNAQIYNVSSRFDHNVGEVTTVRVGDQIHCLTNLQNQASVIFIVSRPVQSSIYWNVSRKYNSTTKHSTRTVEEDGYYHIKMAVDGKQVDLRTKDQGIIDKLDANAARCFGLILNGDVITNVYYPSSVVGSTGGTAGSWSDVTKINGNKIHVKKNTVGASNYGQEEDIVLAPNCKIWNVGGLYTYSGEPTKLQVGDTVHCLLNLEGQATTVFVVGRKAPDRTAVCPVCGKSVKWTGYGGSISGKEGETTHYYLTQDVTMQGQNSVGKNVTMHFDLNGFNLIAPEENRTITAWDEGSNLYIMNTKKDKSPSKIIGGKGTEPGNYGALMWLRQPGAKLTIEDVTIDASKVDQAVTRAVIYVGTGELTLKNVKIIGSKHAGEASVLYVKDIATLENVTIEGGTTDKFGSVYLASGSLTLKGDVRISGGRNDNGENANLYLAKGAKVTVEDLTCPDGSISVRMAEAGVFTNNGVASYLSKFMSDLASGSIAANASGALTWDFEITGIAFKESKLTVAAGKTLNPEIVYTPAAKNGVKLTFTSADPGVVEITSTGEILGVKESGSAGVKVTAETETGLKAETTVVVTAATDTEHYHVEGTHAEIEAGTGTKVSYTAWTETAKIPTKSGYYYLTNDIVMTNNKQPSIPAGQNVHICLNGHSITNTTEGNALTINLFDTAGETLSICDCSSGETGAVIATGSYDIQGRCLWVRANNTLNIYGGNYIGSVSTKEEIGGGTLGVEPNGTLNFYGGTVKGGTSPVAAGNVYINGTFNMYGGTIEGGEAGKGGNILVNNKGTFNMYGGVVKDGTATSATGGNIHVNENGVVNLYGGSIENGKAMSGNGGNLYFSINSVFHAENATVSGGTAKNAGGSIYFKGKDMTVKDSVFENGTTSDSGGNLCISSGPVFMEGVTIRGGSAPSVLKSDIHMNAGQAEVTFKNVTLDGCFYLMGAKNLTLTGNTVMGSNSKTGLYIVNGSSWVQTVTASELGTGAQIHVSADTPKVIVKNGAADMDKFVQHKGEDYELKANGEDLELAEKAKHIHDVSGGKIENGHTFADGSTHTASDVIWKAWTSDSTLPSWSNLIDGDNYFYLTKDVALTKNWIPGEQKQDDISSRHIYLCLNGHNVTTSALVILSTLNKTSPSVTHSSGLTVTITDCSDTPGTISNPCQASNSTLSAFAWLGGQNASLTMYNVTLDGSGFKTSGHGTVIRNIYGVVRLYNVKMLGGTSTNGNGAYYGGGEDTKFYMYGGEISGGTAKEGGNVFSYGDVCLYGAAVKGGTATTGGGGNVKVSPGSGKTFTKAVIEDCTIESGKSKTTGGNVYLSASTVNVKNTTMTGGSCEDAGGNLCLSGSATDVMNAVLENVTMTGGSAANTLKANVLLNRVLGTFTLKDCTIGDGFQMMNAVKLTFTGKTKIGSEGGTGMVVFNDSTTQELVADSLDAEAKIYIQANDSGILVKGGASFADKFVNSGLPASILKVNGDDLEYVNSSKHCVCGGLYEDGETLPDGSVHHCSRVSWTAWDSADSLPTYSDLKDGENFFYLTSDITLPKEWRPGHDKTTNTYVADMAGRNVTISLNGHKILNSVATVFISTLQAVSPSQTHTKNVHVTLTDFKDGGGTVKSTTTSGDLPAFAWLNAAGAEITAYNVYFDATEFVVGKTNKSGKNGSTFRLNYDSKLTLHQCKVEGGTINGKLNSSSAAYTLGTGGIHVASNAVLTMYGGEISGGKITSDDANARGYGANIYLQGKAYLYNGVVKNGEALTNSGNIHMYTASGSPSAELVLKNMEISGGKSMKSPGGNMYIDADCLVTIEDSVITGGQCLGSSAGGGNIYTKAETLVIRNSEITNGKCTDAGGNIMFSAGSNTSKNYTVTLDHVTMSGGKAATANRNNAFVNSSRLTINIQDSTLTGGFLVWNIKAINVSGKTTIGTEAEAGIHLDRQNSSSTISSILNVENLDASSKIYFATNRTGTIAKNAASKDGCFTLVRTSSTPAGTLKMSGTDLVYEP